MPVYCVYLITFFVVPVSVIGWILRKDIRRHPRTIFWSLGFVYALGLVWDWVACKTGVWRYNSAETLGLWIDGLPVEEFIGFYIFGTLLIVGVSLLILRRQKHV